jgi:Mannosyltransferase (PIG-V)
VTTLETDTRSSGREPSGREETARQAGTWRELTRRLRLGGNGVAALRLWLLTRVATFLAVAASGWLFVGSEVHRPTPFLQRWARWDWEHFQVIAQYGYDGPPGGWRVPLEAFFPGLPLAVRLVHVLVGNWTLAGLLISFVAGAVAVVTLAKLADLDNPAGTGERAVLLLLLSPCAVFLAAGYTEALFMAFALPAWLAARRGNWMLAGLLGAGASTTRISGVFLGAALVVEFLTARDGRRRWSQLPWLVLPGVPVLAYFAYLHSRTGDWMAWQHAQERGWYRDFTNPLLTFQHTWNAAFDGSYEVGWAWMFRAELAAMLLGVALTGWLLLRRRWAESVYVGLQVAAFGTSYWYFSVPRATLLWWPLWIGLAAWTLRRPAALSAYLSVVAPFMVIFTLLFSLYRWAG